ncbi:hypothetical protein [Streptomyces sp. AC555_RSS877]|uniref:hypothetical protein n=1 Tax=Streptomyces sp. AC555_RSS877 TaxID=2823688 RepID=UPI0020B6AE46|nr:hypothetical protein [Streptomyces sp. AC555_RSS877]
MANIVWHTKLRIYLDLTKDDLGHPEHPDLWEMVYRMDRMYADRNVPVAERDLQCGGVCQKAGVEAWMHLRLRANGRREAVHERREDEERHVLPMSDEHKAYQERILKAAEEGGFRGDSEVRTRVGRSWIQTDTLIEGADGRRIGWEVQLSPAGTNGPRSVRARASKAEKNGITPAWHTDRSDYAQRHDTHWTRSDSLPAYIIAKTGDLRVVSGFRVLDFWRCDARAIYPCPNGVRRCGKAHATPKPRDVLFDELVRHTAAGTIVPIQFRTATKLHRFWVTSQDRLRLDDLRSDDTELPPLQEPDSPASASRNRPTCKPGMTTATPDHPPPTTLGTTAPHGLIPAQPPAPAMETETAPAPLPALPDKTNTLPFPSSPEDGSGLPDELIALQQAADNERRKLELLDSHEERRQQRQAWFEAAAATQTAVTKYASAKRLNRFEVERRLRQAARDRT